MSRDRFGGLWGAIGYILGWQSREIPSNSLCWSCLGGLWGLSSGPLGPSGAFRLGPSGDRRIQLPNINTTQTKRNYMLGAFRKPLGGILGSSSRSEAVLGPSWVFLEGSGRLGALLGLSWGSLGPSWGAPGAVLGLSWGPHGPSWDDLGGPVGRLRRREDEKGECAKHVRIPKGMGRFVPLEALSAVIC